MTDLEKSLVQCFSTVFPELSEKETLSATTDAVKNWDSLKMVNLLIVIQEEFNISFQPEEYETLTSFDLILSILQIKIT